MPDESIKKLVVDYAIENYKNGLNCAESVYEALLRAKVVDAPYETLAMCTGFGGGAGLTGHLCGALSAGILANGAVHGRKDPMSHPDDVRGPEMSGKYYRRYNNLISDFKKEFGSANCADICKEFESFNSKERKVSCMKLVGKAAEIAYNYVCIEQDEAFLLEYRENIGGLQK